MYDIRYPGYYQYTADELENVKELTASPVWLFIIDKDKRSGEYTDPYTHDIRETYIVDAITGDVSIYNENVSY